jgi:hypothetical protein
MRIPMQENRGRRGCGGICERIALSQDFPGNLEMARTQYHFAFGHAHASTHLPDVRQYRMCATRIMFIAAQFGLFKP